MKTLVSLVAALLVLSAAGYLLVLMVSTGTEDDRIAAVSEFERPPETTSVAPVASSGPEDVPETIPEAAPEMTPMEAEFEPAEPESAGDEGGSPAAPDEGEGGIRVVGTVLDQRTGGPIAGARIEARGRRRDTTARVAASGVDGRYALAGVLPSHRSVVATAEGYASVQRTIGVGPDDAADLRVDLTLQPQARVTGRVLGPDGAPLAGAGVNPYLRVRAPGMGRMRTRPQAETDGDGRFALWLPGGTAERKRQMRLFADKEGYAPGQSPVLELEPGGRIDDVVITVDWSGRVEGRVLREDRRPFQGVDVALSPMTNQRLGVAAADGPVVHLRARSDEEGRFQLPDVPAGTYRLTAWFGRLRMTRDGIVVTRRHIAGGIEFVLPTGRGIAGTVVDESGRPLKGARVGVEPVVGPAPGGGQGGRVRGQQWTMSDDDGRFQVFQLDDVLHRVVVTRQGFKATTLTNVIPGAAPLRAVLARVFAVRGVVVRPDGETPCPEFAIRILSTYQEKPWPGRLEQRRDEGGAFSLESELFTGQAPYWIQVSTEDGLLSGLVPVILASEQEPEPKRIVLRRGARVTGEVRGEDGRPVAEASVALRGEDRRFQRAVRTTTRGRFEMNALPPGDYTLSAAHRDWVGANERLIVAGAEDHRLVLTLLREGASLHVSAADETGAPVPGAFLTLQTGRGQAVGFDMQKYRELFRRQQVAESGTDWAAFYRAASRTDRTGNLEVRFLPGDHYRATLRAAGFLADSAEVTLAPGGRAELRFVLKKRPPSERAIEEADERAKRRAIEEAEGANRR